MKIKYQTEKMFSFFRKGSAFIIILLMLHFVVLSQSHPVSNAKDRVLPAAVTISNYSVAQKQLLVLSTAQFINFVTQNNLDQDSVIAMACQITGMPFFLPYRDGFAAKISDGEAFINSGEITKAVQLLKKLKGEKHIELLLELGVWYLHQSGHYKKDLDNAGFYIKNAAELSNANKYIELKNESLFLLGELYGQKGDTLAAKEIFIQLVSAGQQDGNAETVARAYRYLGTSLPFADSMKKIFYQRSLEEYRKLRLNEKVIELLGDISSCDATVNSKLWENDLRQMISLMQSTGFKHVLYAENQLTVAFGRQGKYVDAFIYANAALENMKWSGIDAVAGSMYIRLGSLYESIGKNDEALLWYKKALNTRKIETHVFWYKSLFFATTMLTNKNPEESLSLMDSIVSQFPPRSVWEQLQILSIKGDCYQKLNKFGLADENYMSFLKLSNQHLSESFNGELTFTYLLIGDFYVSQSNAKKALLFLKKANANSLNSIDIYTNASRYSLQFRIDSLEGNYKSAMLNHIKYKLYADSSVSFDQRQQMDELTVKYAGEKKDQHIKLLTEQGILQQTELKHNKFTSNAMIAGSALMLVIILLLFSQFRLKQRTNKEMNKSNLALKQLVNEKEWLIKEVHHRVKNNLQTIISLLESQAAYLENDALKAIETSQNRIYTMSLIHQKLYQSEGVQTINMASYIPELIKYLRDSFMGSAKIDFHVKVDQINLDASIAIPLALIINEALTNSIKYAFTDNKHGEILINLHEHGELLMLELSDNGIGMDMDSINTSPASLGLQLINGLTKEIHGDINIRSSNGVKITLILKKSAIEYANISELK
jgi:two-component sensor histidine kinase/TPR repeat protein